ncbi:hypothetical protein [Clostridium sp.]|uniref:hypothetical protein n=1 Tax=Clostridium sp. TaxID=1506 RepID=UPI00258590F3|nr:hypothetical protein [Clostridium sp.]MDF2504042.1 hypothetical protein [Clostridium sp.]
MKKKIAYSVLILSLVFLIITINMLYVQWNFKYNNYSKQLTLLQKTNKKADNKVIRYNDIIHLSNKYNGEIKELKNKNKNINASMIIYENKNNINRILDDLKGERTLNKINSISLNNNSLDSENYEIDIDANFVSEY